MIRRVAASVVGAMLLVLLLPTTALAESTVDEVVVIGAAGLTWEDITETGTPALWALANQGSIGALSVRAATGSLTCPVDGWVTLGAGNRARGPARPAGGGCDESFPIGEPLRDADGEYQLVGQEEIAARNEELSYDARPGTLADRVGCATAVGPQAAAAAAHPSGRIDQYVRSLPANPASLLSECRLTIVGTEAITGSGDERAARLTQLDQAVAALDRVRTPRSLLMVVGVADLAEPPRLHVAIVDGPGFARGWLTSASTGKRPYAQLIDVAPTVLAALAVDPATDIPGQQMVSRGERPAELRSNIATLIDADRAAGAHHPLPQLFFTCLVAINIALLVGTTVLLRWRAARAEAVAPRPVPRHLSPRRTVDAAALAVASVLPASFAANALPWWRTPAPGLLYVLSMLIVASGLTAVALVGPWRRHALGPAGFLAAVTAVILAGDVMTGSSLQRNAFAGYSPLVAGRFTGFGNLGFAVFATAALLAVAVVGQRLSGRLRTAVLVSGSVLALVLVGLPAWGNDVGGTIAIAPACCVLALRASGVRISLGWSALVGGAGLAAVAVFAAFDYGRPVESRTHLGRFIAQLGDGTATTVLRRKAEANFSLLIDSQLTFLVIAALLFVPLVLLRTSGGLRRVFGVFPCVRAGAFATVVMAGIGFAVNDSGIAVPAFVVALAVPLAISVTLRVSASARQGIGGNSRVVTPDTPGP